MAPTPKSLISACLLLVVAAACAPALKTTTGELTSASAPTPAATATAYPLPMNPGAAQPGAAVPAADVPYWVRPGLLLTYDGISSYKEQYMTSRGVIATVTSEVIAGDGATYAGRTTVSNVEHPNLVQSLDWSYAMGDPALGGDFVVWVDPTDPTHAYGYPWTVVGQSPYDAAGWTWDATQLIYRVPDTVGEEHLIYDTQSGLVLYRDTDNPYFMQQFRLSSVDYQ